MAKYLLLFICSILLATTVAAQYPFEKYPAVHYKTYTGWKMQTDPYAKDAMENPFYIIIPHFYGVDNLKIKLTTSDSPRTSYISIFKGKKCIQKMREEMPFFSANLTELVRVTDINSDSLLDIKFILPFHGCGLAAMNAQIIYLFQNKNGKFTKFSYTDKLEVSTKTDWENRPERDMDGDGNYEIITMDLQGFKEHNYWTFNLYNYINGKLVNVNDKYDYPLMVQYLFRQNYKPANFSKTIRRKYSLKHPEDIDKRE